MAAAARTVRLSSLIPSRDLRAISPRMRTWIAAALTLTVVAAAACGSGKKDSAKSEANDDKIKSAAGDREGEADNPQQRLPQKRPPTPVTIEEATPLFAVPAAARQVKAPQQ